MKEELLFSGKASSFPLFPELVEKYGWSLIESEDNRRKDKPVDVEIWSKKKDEGCHSGYSYKFFQFSIVLNTRTSELWVWCRHTGLKLNMTI
jgi:hypothetical protein